MTRRQMETVARVWLLCCFLVALTAVAVSVGWAAVLKSIAFGVVLGITVFAGLVAAGVR